MVDDEVVFIVVRLPTSIVEPVVVPVVICAVVTATTEAADDMVLNKVLIVLGMKVAGTQLIEQDITGDREGLSKMM